MPNNNLNQLINETLEEESITLSQNKKEQVKSILIKRSKEHDNQVKKKEIRKIANWVSSEKKSNSLNLLKEFSIINNYFDVKR